MIGNNSLYKDLQWNLDISFPNRFLYSYSIFSDTPPTTFVHLSQNRKTHISHPSGFSASNNLLADVISVFISFFFVEWF